MRALAITALVLMIIGALNWGLVGLFGFNLVAYLFGPFSALTRIIYILVGIAGAYGIAMLTKLSESRQDVCVPGHGEPMVREAR